MKIPVYERRGALAPIPGVRMHAPGGPEAYGASVGRAVEALGKRATEMVQEMEDTQTLEAFRNFQRESMEYHQDPEKGLWNTRLGKDASGLYETADMWLDNKAFEYASKLPSSRAAQNFAKMASGFRLQMGQKNSLFEANQMKAYRIGEADATIQQGLDAIAEGYMDEKLVDDTRSHMMMALELKTRGMGEAAKREAYEAMESQIARGRLGRMIQDDPLGAEKWFEEHKGDFRGAELAKVEALVKKSVALYKTQEAVDSLVQKFGPDEESQGIAWIRKNKSGEEEEQLVAAYKQRVGEAKIRLGNERKALAQAQKKVFQDLYVDYYARGEVPPQELLDGLLESRKISPAQHRQMVGWGRARMSRQGVEDYLSRDPAWGSYSPQKREELVMAALGVSKERNREIVASINASIATLTEDQVEDYYRNNLITEDQKAQYMEALKTLPRKQKAFIARQKTELALDMKKIDVPGKNDGDFAKMAQARFGELLLDLDPGSSTYRHDVMEAREEALLWAVKQTGEVLEKTSFFSGEEKSTSFGERVSEVIQSIEEQKEAVEEYRPELPEVSSGEAEPFAVQGPEEEPRNVALEMVPGRITGRFDDWREYRKGRHNGIDIAAPEGSPIRMFDPGTSMKVITVGQGSKTAGNFVRLEGTLEDGRKLWIQVSHMQKGSVNCKEGDTLAPGDIIGAVGNTGKSTGPHMDLKIKVDGEYVDPETFSLGKTRASRVPGVKEIIGEGTL